MALDESNLTIFPCVLRNVLIIISNTTGLSFALKRIGPLAAILISRFYLLVVKFLVTTKPTTKLACSFYSETLLKSTCQHLMLLVGFDTLTYRKGYDRSPILVGQQGSTSVSDPSAAPSSPAAPTPSLVALSSPAEAPDSVRTYVVNEN